MKIVYIAGYGHSGSTLYGVILGAAKGHLNAGELYRLGGNEAVPRFDAPLADPQLEAVRKRLRAFVASNAQIRSSTGALESVLSFRGNGSLVTASRYNKYWQGIFDVIARETGAEILIDSSKTAWGQLRRPQLLRQAGHDVSIIHLVKDPRSLMCSRETKKGRVIGLKSLLGWAMTNWGTWRLYSSWGPHYMVSFYEEFTASPQDELNVIETFIGTDLSAVQARLAAGRGFDPGLQFGGNRAGRHPEVFWRPPPPSKGARTRLCQIIGSMAMPLFFFLAKQKTRGRPQR